MSGTHETKGYGNEGSAPGIVRHDDCRATKGQVFHAPTVAVASGMEQPSASWRCVGTIITDHCLTKPLAFSLVQ